MLHGQRNNAGTDPDVIPFGRGGKSAPAGNNDQLDKAGQTILQLLNKAADVAEGNSRHAIDMAQKLSHQLRAAEDRTATTNSRAHSGAKRHQDNSELSLLRNVRVAADTRNEADKLLLRAPCRQWQLPGAAELSSA